MGTLESPSLIAGAGIGGLALAHGLARVGRPFRIFEKDAGPQARDQGYRLHLDGTAVAALKECLNDAAFDAFWQLSEPLGNGFAFFDHRLRQLAYFASRFYNASSPARVIARSTLRQLLLQMLPAEVEFDRAAKQFSVRDDGSVELQFEHGPSAPGSFLVGAEGSNAATARQLIPDQPLSDTGSLAVIGKVPTSEQILRWMPHGRFERLCIVLGPQDVNLFLSQHLPGHADDKIAAQTPQFADLLGPLPGFSVWAFMIRDAVFAGDGDPVQLPGATLKDTVQRTIAGWHPHLQQLVAAADPAHVTCTRMRSADHLSTWDTLPQVTLLGDALHTMTPLQGQGASAAVRDALALLQLLKQGPPSRDRLQRYEAAVVARVKPAVRSSRRTLAWAMTRHAQKAVFKWGIRVADAFTPG